MFVIIKLKGGENTKRFDNRLLFTLILSIMLVFSISCVFAESNETVSDVVSAPIELDDVCEVPQNQEVSNLVDEEPILADGNNGINVHVNHYYNETSKTWDDEGYDLAGATVNLYDSSNNLVKTLITDSKGEVKFSNLNSDKYHIEVTYSTYAPSKSDVFDFTSQSGVAKTECKIVPDILLIVIPLAPEV
jgi:cobaltochelatase CobN